MERMSLEVLTADLIADSRCEIGESPVWDGRYDRLLWVDISGERIHALELGIASVSEMVTPSAVGSIALRRDGGLVMALDDGFWVTDRFQGDVHRVAASGEPTSNRMNDGKCDSAGRFWAGSMAYDKTPGAGSLYRLDPRHGLERVLADVTVSNGIAWSPDDRTMYFVDSATPYVDAFDYDAERGRLSRRRHAIFVDPADGHPDGITVDRDGHIWVALWEGRSVCRYTPTGHRELIVNVPFGYVSSCAFGGRELDDLFITTARLRMTPEQLADQPQAGGVYRCRPGVQGLAPATFDG